MPGWIYLLVVLLSMGTTHAQEVKEVSPGGPLTITSERMILKNNEKRAVFEVNVVITKGTLIMTADYVEILLESDYLSDTSIGGAEVIRPSSPLSDNTISQLRAWGNVKLEHDMRHAEAREAIYYPNEEKIELSGEAVLHEKDYKVTGTRMTFFLEENRSIVESSRVLILPTESSGTISGEK